MAMSAMYQAIHQHITESKGNRGNQFEIVPEGNSQREIRKQVYDNPEALNKKSLQVINRIKEKLIGRDFKSHHNS
jgi:hypothetical protein